MPPRKRATKRTTKRARAAGVANLARGRAPKRCAVCGRDISANNYQRHLRTHGLGEVAAAGPTHADIAPADRTVAVAVGALLEQYAAAAARGKQGRVDDVVQLGRIGRGFPSSTRDPDVVERVLALYDAEVIPSADTPLVELRARQRRRDLARDLERLRASSNGSSPREVFVRHGADWARRNGIEYATFRDMGLPAGLLRAAGIRP